MDHSQILHNQNHSLTLDLEVLLNQDINTQKDNILIKEYLVILIMSLLISVCIRMEEVVQGMDMTLIIVGDKAIHQVALSLKDSLQLQEQLLYHQN